MHKTRSGFTIVELLIVIVVIAILATVTVVAYNGVQDRARAAKATSDLQLLEKAIMIGRVNTSKTLYQITGSGCTYCGEDADYISALDKISAASGVDLSPLKKGDPWWNYRYLIDENEGEYSGDPCVQDKIWAAGDRPNVPEILIPTYSC